MRTTRARRAVFAVLEIWARALPERVATEDLGGFIESLHRSRGVYFWLGIPAVFSWTAVNALRESRGRWIVGVVVLNLLVGALYAFGGIQYLYYAKAFPAAVVQVGPAVVIALFWFMSAFAVWRDRPQRDALLFATAGATIVHASMLYSLGIMGGLAFTVNTVYPAAIILIYWMKRRRLQPS